jgi:hypothetical protein
MALPLLLECLGAGITVSIDGRDLRIKAPPGAVTEALRRCIKNHKADLLKAIRGDIKPRPCMRSLANAYRRRSGEGFREAFQRVTGCDIWKETPEWIALYTFEACIEMEAAPNARQRDSPIGVTTASANQMGGWEP